MAIKMESRKQSTNIYQTMLTQRKNNVKHMSNLCYQHVKHVLNKCNKYTTVCVEHILKICETNVNHMSNINIL